MSQPKKRARAEKVSTAVRREQIVEGALRVVAREGPAALSVAAVAAEVGLTPSGLYRHFAGLDEVLDGALGLLRERLLANVEAARLEAASPLDALRGVLLRHLRLVRDSPGVPRLVFSDEVVGGSPERRGRMLALIRTYQARIAALLAEARRAGLVRREVDPEAAALLFLGLIQPAALLAQLSGGALDPLASAERLWGLFVAAVGEGAR